MWTGRQWDSLSTGTRGPAYCKPVCFYFMKHSLSDFFVYSSALEVRPDHDFHIFKRSKLISANSYDHYVTVTNVGLFIYFDLDGEPSQLTINNILISSLDHMHIWKFLQMIASTS